MGSRYMMILACIRLCDAISNLTETGDPSPFGIEETGKLLESNLQPTLVIVVVSLVVSEVSVDWC